MHVLGFHTMVTSPLLYSLTISVELMTIGLEILGDEKVKLKFTENFNISDE